MCLSLPFDMTFFLCFISLMAQRFYATYSWISHFDDTRSETFRNLVFRTLWLVSINTLFFVVWSCYQATPWTHWLNLLVFFSFSVNFLGLSAYKMLSFANGGVYLFLYHPVDLNSCFWFELSWLEHSVQRLTVTADIPILFLVLREELYSFTTVMLVVYVL